MNCLKLTPLMALTVGLCLYTATSLAGQRKALIIGNGDYETIPPLTDPLNDVDLMTSIFEKKLKFRVYPYKNLTGARQKAAFDLFKSQIARGDEIAIFYSGHGVQINRENYILPVDLNVKFNSELIEQSLSIEELLTHANESGASLSVIFLDACRTDTELLEDDTQGNAKSAFSHFNGTARSQASRINDVLTCYATKQGTPAYEGSGLYSTYTQALAEELVQPGQPLMTSMHNVRNKVLRRSNQKQKPFFEGSLGDDIVWYPGNPTEIATRNWGYTPPPPTTDPAPVRPQYDRRQKLIVSYTGNDGLNIRNNREVRSTSNLHGALYQQAEIPLVQIGAPVREGSNTWVQVEVKGWIPTSSNTNVYLQKRENRNWKVVWNRPGDNFVAMRTGASKDRKLICKVAYATYVEEMDSTQVGSVHYIYGRFTGWAVMKGSTSTYIREIY